MTTNETIARSMMQVVPIEKDPPSFGDIIIAGGNCSVWTDCGWQYWEPDTDIAFWHGDNGLLAEIKRRGGDKDSLSRDLHREWMSQRVEAEDPPFDRQMPYADEIAAAYLRATPAQLAAALVKVIEEGE